MEKKAKAKKAAPAEQKVEMWIPAILGSGDGIPSPLNAVGTQFEEMAKRTGRFFRTKDMCENFIEVSNELFDEMRHIENVMAILAPSGVQLVAVKHVGHLGVDLASAFGKHHCERPGCAPRMPISADLGAKKPAGKKVVADAKKAKPVNKITKRPTSPKMITAKAKPKAKRK